MDTTEAWEGWHITWPSKWHHWAPTAAADFRSTTCFHGRGAPAGDLTRQSPGCGRSVDPVDRSRALSSKVPITSADDLTCQHSEHHFHIKSKPSAQSFVPVLRFNLFFLFPGGSLIQLALFETLHQLLSYNLSTCLWFSRPRHISSMTAQAKLMLLLQAWHENSTTVVERTNNDG